MDTGHQHRQERKMSEILCIYHGNCADGFSATWAVWKKFPEAKFRAGVYGQEPPDVSNKHVVLVDFCYKPDVLKCVAKKAKSMLILDHHKSSVEEIKAYKERQFVHMFDAYAGVVDWDRHMQWCSKRQRYSVRKWSAYS